MTTTAPVHTTGSATRITRGPRAGTGAAYRWELVKLVALVRVRAMIIGCLVAPPIIVLILRGQRPPADTLYGKLIHLSGFAVPLLLLGFISQWVFPLLTSLVAGDIFASEDQHGTWKTILTRSVSRAQVFRAKTLAALTFAAVVFVVLAFSAIASGVLLVGRQPLTGLTGQTIAPATALGLVIAAWAAAFPVLVGFTALSILLSVRTRNPALGVVGPVVLGLAMSLLGSVGGIGLLRRALLTTPLDAWHGLLTATPFYGPLVQGLVVCAFWTLLCLALAYRSLSRRDLTEG
jgi:ABC-2 type transport system permease protein